MSDDLVQRARAWIAACQEHGITIEGTLVPDLVDRIVQLEAELRRVRAQYCPELGIAIKEDRK